MPELALTRSLTAALCGILVLPATVFAADGESTRLHIDDAAPRAVRDSASSGTGSMLVRTIVGLAVVIGVIFGLHWILKQVKASRESRSTGGGLHSIATLALGPGRSLHLVRAGTEIVLVGASENGVVPVRTYTEDEARRLGLLTRDDPIVPSAPPRRGSWLNELRSRTVIR